MRPTHDFRSLSLPLGMSSAPVRSADVQTDFIGLLLPMRRRMPRLIINDLCIGASGAVSSFRMKQEALRDDPRITLVQLLCRRLYKTAEGDSV